MVSKIIELSVSCMIFLMLGTAAVPAGGQTAEKAKPRLRTVVIDPGHGGKDAGCVSRDRKTYEKNVTLAISKMLGAKIKENYPDVAVYYTRLTDRYLTLNERADIANRNHADLFISVHINSNESTSPSGFSAHIFGRSSGKDSDLFANNMDVCRRENSVILLEDDYSTKYQGFDPDNPESFIFFNLMQHAFYEQSLLFAGQVVNAMDGGPIVKNRGISQDSFYVLWKTTMPSVLLELGFMSNYADLKILNSETGRRQIADRVFNAFKEFKEQYDGSLDYSIEPAPAGKEMQPESDRSASEGTSVMYGIQIFSLSKRLPDGDRTFKGYRPEIIRTGNVYKYIIGMTPDEKEAREMFRNIKKKFPDSFPVKVAGGDVRPLK